jgi:DNA-binding NtrC family response regulator
MTTARAVNLIGASSAFTDALQLIHSIGQTDAPVLIEGETGTGKELAARAIHYSGLRASMPFIPVNCGAIPDALVENELFGHGRGAYTDARDAQVGLVAQADGGTLFLDEVDALPPRAQVALLRFLQDLFYRPLGARREQHADVRVIAATNVDLVELARKRRFRLDLVYRLKVLGVLLPPLRERTGDVELLAEHFVGQLAVRYRRAALPLDPSWQAWCATYRWPGNVRELENLIHRAFLLATGPAVRIPDPTAPSADPPAVPVPALSFTQAKARAIQAFERDFLVRLLAEHNGNVSVAARRCGKERRSFGRLLKKHRIDRRTYAE